jgi:hypothetical protein
MNRAALEHILRAAAAVANERELVAFLRVLLRERMAEVAMLRERVSALSVSPDHLQALTERLHRLVQASGMAARG